VRDRIPGSLRLVKRSSQAGLRLTGNRSKKVLEDGEVPGQLIKHVLVTHAEREGAGLQFAQLLLVGSNGIRNGCRVGPPAALLGLRQSGLELAEEGFDACLPPRRHRPRFNGQLHGVEGLPGSALGGG